MKKYAMMIMGNYDTNEDRFECIHGRLLTRLVTVGNLEEAKKAARTLCDEGFGCIELCGAFGKEGARALIEETNGKIAIGYVIHEPEQDALFAAFFGESN